MCDCLNTEMRELAKKRKIAGDFFCGAGGFSQGLKWGPLGADKQPLKTKRGDTFLAFIAALKSLGYRVEHRILCCADYGDPTTRERLFIIARRGCKPIVWPEPTHVPTIVKSQVSMFGGKANPWRTAREIIDWELKGESIFTRKRPLAQKTIDRIAAGLRKFGGPNAEPFLVMLYGTNDVRSVDKPVPTVTANGKHIGLCEPFILPNEGYYRGNAPRSVDDPLPTITAERGGGHLVEPFIIGQQSGAHPRSVDDPVPTVCGAGAIALVVPFLLNIDHRGGNGQQVRSIDEPVPTITGKARTCIVEPFLVGAGGPERAGKPRSLDKPLNTVLGKNTTSLIEPFLIEVNHAETGNGVRSAKSLEEPLSTVTQKRAHGLVEPFIVPQFGEREGQSPRCHSIDEPLPTATSHGAGALVEPFIVQYNRTSEAHEVDKPLNTVTSRDRFGLVTTEQGTFKLDIRFRMLTNRELARAQGLPDSYILKGKKTEITKQIGNMVPRNTARALCAQVLS